MANEKDWLARVAVAALVIWLPLQLLLGVVPHATVYELLKDGAFANVAQALGAIGSLGAVLAALWIAGKSDTQRRLDGQVAAATTLMTRAALVNFTGERAADLANCVGTRDDDSGYIAHPEIWNQAVDDLRHAGDAIKTLTLRDISTVEELLLIQRARAHIGEIAYRYGVASGDNQSIDLSEQYFLEDKAAFLRNVAKGLAKLAHEQRAGSFASVGSSGGLDHFDLAG